MVTYQGEVNIDKVRQIEDRIGMLFEDYQPFLRVCMGPQNLDQFQRKERPQMPLFLQFKTLLEEIRRKCFNLFNFTPNSS